MKQKPEQRDSNHVAESQAPQPSVAGDAGVAPGRGAVVPGYVTSNLQDRGK